MHGLCVRLSTVTTTTWATYMSALSSSQSEIAIKVGTAQSTVSRWLSGDVVPDARQVITVARAYSMSPVVALVAAGYLTADEITNSGAQPRALSLHEFTDHELVREMLRRVEDGQSHPELDAPLDETHPAVREQFADNVTAIRPAVSGPPDDVETDQKKEPKAAGSDRTEVGPTDVEP